MADATTSSPHKSHPTGDTDVMPTDAPRRWLVEWFTGRDLPMDDPSVSLEADYFDRGWLDSLGVLDLVEAAESHFQVRFSSAHFEDPRFRSIAGLASIIEEVRSGR